LIGGRRKIWNTEAYRGEAIRGEEDWGHNSAVDGLGEIRRGVPYPGKIPGPSAVKMKENSSVASGKGCTSWRREEQQVFVRKTLLGERTGWKSILDERASRAGENEKPE